MSVYAPVPAFADRRRHPRALVIIVAAHVALLAAVMTVKMDLPTPWDPTVTTVKLVPEPALPPENPPPPQPTPEANQKVDQVPPIVPTPSLDTPKFDPLPLPLPSLGAGPVIGTGDTVESIQPREPVRTGPRFATPDSRIKPPYPQHKLRSDEEASLRLRLAIDARGRVVAVEPVAPADPAFLAAARRHILANWRYQPATEDGKAVASSTVITLRFELE